jgi:protein SCO1
MLSRRDLITGVGAAALGLALVKVDTAQAESSAKKRGPRADYFPNVTLYTHEGKPVRFYDDLIAGKVVAFNVMYTQCKGNCPIATANLKAVHQILGDRVGKDTFMYSITFQPEQDTPEALREYMQMHGVAPGWTFLTGAPEDVTQVRRQLGFYDIDPEVDGDKATHTGMVRIGNEALDRWCMEPVIARADQIARTILRLHLQPEPLKSPKGAFGI